MSVHSSMRQRSLVEVRSHDGQRQGSQRKKDLRSGVRTHYNGLSGLPVMTHEEYRKHRQNFVDRLRAGLV